MSSSPTTCGVVMASTSLRRGIGLPTVGPTRRTSWPRALCLEFFQPFDLAAVGLDAPRNGERGERQQNRGRQYDALPQVSLGAEYALRDTANHLPPERAEEDEHEE